VADCLAVSAVVALGMGESGSLLVETLLHLRPAAKGTGGSEAVKSSSYHSSAGGPLHLSFKQECLPFGEQKIC